MSALLHTHKHSCRHVCTHACVLRVCHALHVCGEYFMPRMCAFLLVVSSLSQCRLVVTEAICCRLYRACIIVLCKLQLHARTMRLYQWPGRSIGRRARRHLVRSRGGLVCIGDSSWTTRLDLRACLVHASKSGLATRADSFRGRGPHIPLARGQQRAAAYPVSYYKWHAIVPRARSHLTGLTRPYSACYTTSAAIRLACIISHDGST